LSRDEKSRTAQLHADQLIPAQHSLGQAEPVALPRRRALSLYLRGRPRPLLLAAARLSRRSARKIHARRYAPRISHRKTLCATLHRLMRASGFDIRLLARSAETGTGGLN